MKYLKVKRNIGSESIKDLAVSIKNCYPRSVSSVEIFDDEDPTPKFPEIKKTEIGVLDIGEGVTIGRESWTAQLHNGDPVDLVKYPAFRRFCKEIKIEWNFHEIPPGALIEVLMEVYAECSLSPNYGRYKNCTDECIFYGNYSTLIESIKSIRIVEGPK